MIGSGGQIEEWIGRSNAGECIRRARGKGKPSVSMGKRGCWKAIMTCVSKGHNTMPGDSSTA